MKGWAKYVLGRKKQEESAPLVTVPRVLAFDFDGTIADTFQAGHDILNILAKEFGFRPLMPEDLEHARDMRTRQLMKFLGIPMRKMSRIAHRGSQELSSRMDTVQPCAGMVDLLKELKRRGFILGIITSNTAENVGLFLRKYDLDFFDFIRCSSKLMGKSREIRAALKKQGVEPHDLLFIGDETRDIDASQKAEIPVVGVTWGYNSRRAIESVKPTALIDRPEQLLELLDDRAAKVALAAG